MVGSQEDPDIASRDALVYAPAHPDPRRVGRSVEFEVRALSDGTRALPVFTTLDRLVEALGPAQPWALLPLRAVRALMGLAEIPQVLVDPSLGADVWRWTEDDLIDLAGAVR
jgi:hypothetical protein